MVSYHVSPFLNFKDDPYQLTIYDSMPDLTPQLENSDTTDTRDTSGTTGLASPVGTSSSMSTISNALTESTSDSTSTAVGRCTTSATRTQSEPGSYR